MLDDRSYMRATRRPYWSMTTILLVSLAICFIIQNILYKFLADPYEVNRLFALSNEGLSHHYYWQVLTFQFMHAGFWHLIGNAIGLYFFGRAMEEMLGGKGLLLLYLLSGTIGGLVQVALGLLFPLHFAGQVLGASAGVFGLIAAFATRAPDQPITLLVLFVLPITFPAKVLLLIEALIAVAGLFIPIGGYTAHAAHLGGMLTGIAFVRWAGWSQGIFGGWRPFARRRPSRESVGVTAQRAWRRPRRAEEAGSGDFISREVDPILEKISAHGIHSLTERERQILEAARKKMAKR
jgi:membrane associated rhomboid family serine protease